MLRDCTLEDISDGKLYSENDMVKADTNSCNGCKSVCCHGMGKTIVLDPYDTYRLTAQFKCSFEDLLKDRLELNVVDGVIKNVFNVYIVTILTCSSFKLTIAR